MNPASEITACVVDNGVFPHVARRLARDFETVYYWSPQERAFPTIRDCCIGDGFDGVERVDSPWRVKDQCDLFVFPDIGFSAMQAELISQGRVVWGARGGDSLEINRGKFLGALEEAGLPVAKHEIIKGITNLRLFLKDKGDKFIKMSRFRGDFETFHWRDWGQDESALDAYAVRFGPLKEQATFYVFDPIDTDIEDGVDAYCIDGLWPETVIHGFENKDKSYLGTFQKFSDLPEEVRKVNEAFGPILAEYEYRSMFSTEVRITKEGESFFIDPTCRFGSPPSQVQCEMIENLGEIIWAGANGRLVEPKPAAKFGVQALIKVDRSDWAVMDIPDEIDQWVKFAFSCKSDGRTCIPPDEQGVSEIGWLVAVGDTIEEAVSNLREHKEQLPDGVCCEFNSLSDLLKEVKEAEDKGMEFTDQPVPEPAIVLED